MSLRDQLLKAGLADKKRAQKLAREEKKRRKQNQGHRQRQSDMKRQHQEQQQRQKEELAAHHMEQKRARDAENEQRERVHQIKQIVESHSVSCPPGPQRFWVVGPDTVTVRRLDLSPALARDLRLGKLGVAWLGDKAQPDLRVVDRASLDRIRELTTERVLFLNVEPAPDDPDQQLLPY